MEKENCISENSKLSRVTFITCVGDYLSFFAFLKIASISGSASIYAGAGVIVQSLATGSGGFILNHITSKFNSKQILITTQIVSMIFSFLNLFYYLRGNTNLELYLLNLFVLTAMYVIFETTKEVHSRKLKKEEAQSAQISLLNGLYKAQFIGPMISYLMLSNFPIWCSLAVDLFSFLIAAASLRNISRFDVNETTSTKESMYELFTNRFIVFFLLLRAVTFWMGFGMFNSIIFKYIENLGHQTIDSAWMYVLIGFGALLATKFMKYFKHKQISVWNYAIYGGLGLGLSILSLNYINSYPLFLFVCVIIGFFVGIETVATQTIRRDIMSDRVAPTYLGVEVSLSKIIDIVSATIALSLIAEDKVSLNHLFWITSGLSILTGFGYIFLKKNQKSIEDKKDKEN